MASQLLNVGIAGVAVGVGTLYSPWTYSGADRLHDALFTRKSSVIQFSSAARDAAKLVRAENQLERIAMRASQKQFVGKRALMLGTVALGTTAIRSMGEDGLQHLGLGDSAAKSVIGASLLGAGIVGLRKYTAPNITRMWRSPLHAASVMVAVMGATGLLTGVADAISDSQGGPTSYGTSLAMAAGLGLLGMGTLAVVRKRLPIPTLDAAKLAGVERWTIVPPAAKNAREFTYLLNSSAWNLGLMTGAMALSVAMAPRNDTNDDQPPSRDPHR